MDWSAYDAVLFDLDGVITPTADVHMRAWSEMFNGFLDRTQAPYTEADYFRYVDGKPRYDGVRDFLASRGLTLPEGNPTDAPDTPSVCGLGNRKNQLFTTIIERDGVVPYPGSVRLIEQLMAEGRPMAVVSSSKNAVPVLRAARLEQCFPVVVDGHVATREHLAGKPAPDTFHHAAARLGVANARAVVLEDAVAGVQAGAAGGFGLVIGVDRGVGADALTTAGADFVVQDLEELV